MGACGASCGITRARERDRDAARALARRVWPDGRRGTPAWAPPASPVGADELTALARRFEELLPARCVLAPAPSDDLAGALYIIATVADETWTALREGAARRPPECLEERGLRLAFSPFGRLATLQEVTLTGAREGGGLWIEERRAAGVEDTRLRPFVRVAQGELRALRVTELDAAFLREPLDDGAESLWHRLFDPSPPSLTVGEFVPT